MSNSHPVFSDICIVLCMINNETHISDNSCCFTVSCPTQDLNMRYIAAALLLAQAGEEVNAANITKVLGSVGVEVDKTNLDIVLKNIDGKSLDELMAEGSAKLASVGGGAGAAVAAPAAAADAGAAPAKEEKKEEPEEEEDDDMGFGLFD